MIESYIINSRLYEKIEILLSSLVLVQTINWVRVLNLDIFDIKPTYIACTKITPLQQLPIDR